MYIFYLYYMYKIEKLYICIYICTVWQLSVDGFIVVFLNSFSSVEKYKNLTPSLYVILNQSKVKFHCLKKVLGQNSVFFLISTFQNLINTHLFWLRLIG